MRVAHIGFIVIAMCASVCAQAQTAAAREQVAQAADPCRAEVSKFEQAIGFVRAHQGNDKALELKEKLLPAKVEKDLLFSEGYCGLARYLREKKLNQ